MQESGPKLGRALLGPMPVREGLPRPDWWSVQARWMSLPAEARASAWSQVERAWQEATASAWRSHGRGFMVREEGELLVTSDLPAAEVDRVYALGRRTLGVIERCLAGLGVESYVQQSAGYNGAGLDVVVICRRRADYEDYVADAEPEERAGEGRRGVCLRQGSVHVAAWGATADALAAPLARAWSHSRLSQWDLPAWLRNGMATHLREAVAPSGRYEPNLQTAALHRGYWTPGRLGRFFDGTGFDADTESRPLTDHLAHTVFGGLLLRGETKLLQYLEQITSRDAGAEACAAVYGCGLDQLLPEAVREAAAANADRWAEEAADDGGIQDHSEPGVGDDDAV